MTTISLNNPYWDEIKDRLDEVITPWNLPVWQYEPMIKPGRIDLLWTKRNDFCRKYAWAIPDPIAVAFVATWCAPLAIEIGAGTGYWAWQLSQLGVNILAYDIDPPDTRTNHYHTPQDKYNKLTDERCATYHPVLPGGPEVLAHHSERTLFLCWPPYDTSMARECLEHYQGQRLVYIGEGEGGCTADDAFHDLLYNDWTAIAEQNITKWDGIHDIIAVYQRNHEA